MVTKAILSVCLSLGLIMPALAEEDNIPAENVSEEQVAETAPQAEPQEQIAEAVAENAEQTKENILENTNLSLDKEKKPEAVIEHQVEKDIKVIPACDDEKLQKNTIEYIQKYFDATPNQSTIFRRHKYFVLHNLDKFAEENLADYKTAATSPVSDIIAYIKMNRGVIEENMRLCKNTSTNNHVKNIYLLVYPEDDSNYRVNVINLSPSLTELDKTNFVYAK